MDHGQQEVKPSIRLGRNWSKLPEDISQRDIFYISYSNQKRMESQQEAQTPGGRATRIRDNKDTIQAIEEQLKQTDPTLIPSASQGVDQPNSPVASHHSGNSTSVTKSHHSSQSHVVSMRIKGYKGKNKTSFSHRQKESDPMIQKLLDLVKEVHKSQK
ncbi:hypothetical protein O181_017035 [Austropuccinia psidii MF-1]|uniref:Uncharacterized protein n=1 Tax=Austropuccinia psidii MF-1 TaxID=1389203 RepID=A0A9Q3C616_9BASI|nr:hypothetical protein [Austropuccinia psidii MF-1]